MVEEALNFGMNATQLSQVSKLQSKIAELDKSLQGVANNLESIRNEHQGTTEQKKQELKKQQKVLELRASVFNFKNNMDGVYQSDTLKIEDKYLQFREACRSSAIQDLNPDYFETFQDKEYTVDVKRNLIKTKNDLFDRLNNSKKHIIQTIENKEKKLKNMIGSVRKPIPPVKPLLVLDKHKKIKEPQKPKYYYSVPKEIRVKDSTLGEGGDTFYYILLLLGTIALSSIPMYIIETIIGKGKNNLIVILPLIPAMFWYMYFGTRHFKKYELRKEFYEYENSMSKYQEYIKPMKKLLKEHELRLKFYIDNQETILQAYQNELNGYQNHKEQIENLRQEITELYQDFAN